MRAPCVGARHFCAHAPFLPSVRSTFLTSLVPETSVFLESRSKVAANGHSRTVVIIAPRLSVFSCFRPRLALPGAQRGSRVFSRCGRSSHDCVAHVSRASCGTAPVDFSTHQAAQLTWSFRDLPAAAAAVLPLESGSTRERTR